MKFCTESEENCRNTVKEPEIEGETMSEKRKSRVFICFDFKYPYQNANSNYIRNFAQAIAQNDNFDVIVIGAEQAEKAGALDSLETFNKTKYVNFQIPPATLPFRMVNHLTFGRYLCQQLRIFSPTKEDYIILYNDYPDTSKRVLKEYRELNESGHVSSVVVEWFQPYQYKLARMNPDYILWNYNFTKWLPKFKKIISISTYVSEHFERLGCNCLTVPCLSDISAQKAAIVEKNLTEKYHFTYVGAFVKKDAIAQMVQGLTLLDETELSRMCFHFTAITEENIKEDCGISEKEWEKIKNSLVFHGWMEYEDLLHFYQTMDFLVLAREKNVMTLSNFPSKIPEMMGYGIIPVCSDVGDYTAFYLENGKDSIVFQGCSKEKCAEAIRSALELSPEHLAAMKHAARKKVEDKLDFHNWSDALQAFLK